MVAIRAKSFGKGIACPSSNLLLSFRSQVLAPEINSFVLHHLAGCDYCYCEVPLLAFYSAPSKGDCRVPEVPINLRVLAESILGQDKSENIEGETATDGKDLYGSAGSFS
jgi:hypothetical protein